MDSSASDKGRTLANPQKVAKPASYEAFDMCPPNANFCIASQELGYLSFLHFCNLPEDMVALPVF